MRRWHEEHDRSGYESRDSMRSRDDRRHDDLYGREENGRWEMHRPEPGGSTRGRTEHERSSYGPAGRESYSDRRGYEEDRGRRGYDTPRRESYGYERQDRLSHERPRHDDLRHDRDHYDRDRRDQSSHRFLYDNGPSERRHDRDLSGYQERSRDEYTSRARYQSDGDDWDDRPRISGPVRLDADDIRNSRERRERESHEARMRAGDFEQYRGRDAGFSWSDGSNSSSASHDYNRWGNEYSNTSRREGMGWNRGSTRDPHFWSSPDRDR